VANLRTQIREARIVAPIDGTITAVDLAPGSDSTGTAFTIASSTYDVTADVAESDISSVSMGQDATVTVAAIDAAIQGKVSAIAPAASSSSGSSGVVSFPVTVTLTGAPGALRPGMTTDVTIVSASADNVLTIPSEALRGSTGSYRVQVLGADGVPVSRDVTVGLVTATTSEIRSGLTEGEVVVTGTSAQRAATSGNGNGRNGFGGGGLAVPGGGVTFSKP
jgi:RND family efflux transporter MFP subunit